MNLHRRQNHRARRMSETKKTRDATSLRFIGVYRKCFVMTAARMCHMICAPSKRALRRDINHIEHERRMDRNRWMQTARWLPRPVSYTTDKVAVRSGRLEWQAPSIAGDRQSLI